MGDKRGLYGTKEGKASRSRLHLEPEVPTARYTALLRFTPCANFIPCLHLVNSKAMERANCSPCSRGHICPLVVSQCWYFRALWNHPLRPRSRLSAATGVPGLPQGFKGKTTAGGGAGGEGLGHANGTPRHNQHSPSTPTTGLRERGYNTSRSTGRSGRQKAATRCNMRRQEQVTVQGPVTEQQPDGMSHRGAGGAAAGKEQVVRH